jgi:hypothetical protein
MELTGVNCTRATVLSHVAGACRKCTSTALITGDVKVDLTHSSRRRPDQQWQQVHKLPRQHLLPSQGASCGMSLCASRRVASSRPSCSPRTAWRSARRCARASASWWAVRCNASTACSTSRRVSETTIARHSHPSIMRLAAPHSITTEHNRLINGNASLLLFGLLLH